MWCGVVWGLALPLPACLLPRVRASLDARLAWVSLPTTTRPAPVLPPNSLPASPSYLPALPARRACGHQPCPVWQHLCCLHPSGPRRGGAAGGHPGGGGAGDGGLWGRPVLGLGHRALGLNVWSCRLAGGLLRRPTGHSAGWLVEGAGTQGPWLSASCMCVCCLSLVVHLPAFTTRSLLSPPVATLRFFLPLPQ